MDALISFSLFVKSENALAYHIALNIRYIKYYLEKWPQQPAKLCPPFVMHVEICYLNDIARKMIYVDTGLSHIFKDNTYYFEKKAAIFFCKMASKMANIMA